MKIKPALPKGTRDFLPKEVARRNYIFETIKTVFRKYGFEQIETPAFERLETLTGKYGEEGDKLLFKILNSGNPFKDLTEDDMPSLKQGSKEFIEALITKHGPQILLEENKSLFESELASGSAKIVRKITEKGLRYDHTVPLARYVVQHQDELAFPFKRFAVGPVWRADRPQKGRYQEFYQFDADVIGSTSLLNEVELTQIYAEVFNLLNIPATVKLNNRKLIDDIFEFAGVKEEKTKAITAIDKLDKIGWEGEKGVAGELKSLGLTDETVATLRSLVLDKSLTELKETLNNSTGVAEVESVMNHFAGNASVQFSASLMRGLDYYTGTVWEIALNDNRVSIGSLGGGGRYDNLTEIFGAQGMTGVGISFGIERVYIVMEELGLFPDSLSAGVKVLFVPRDSSVEEFTFSQVQALREAGISAEIFLGNVKKQKHFNYAEQKGIVYMVEIGANEVQSKSFRLRHVKERREEGAGFTLESLKQKLA